MFQSSIIDLHVPTGKKKKDNQIKFLKKVWPWIVQVGPINTMREAGP